MIISKLCECGQKAGAFIRGRFVSVDKDHDQCMRCFESTMDSSRARCG